MNTERFRLVHGEFKVTNTLKTDEEGIQKRDMKPLLFKNDSKSQPLPYYLVIFEWIFSVTNNSGNLLAEYNPTDIYSYWEDKKPSIDELKELLKESKERVETYLINRSKENKMIVKSLELSESEFATAITCL